MPLLLPFAYIVSYDLKGPEAAYGPLLDELRKSDRWWHFLQSTWIVLCRETLVELGIRLRLRIRPTDFLLILPAKGPADGLLPQEAWDWIRQFVPKEW